MVATKNRNNNSGRFASRPQQAYPASVEDEPEMPLPEETGSKEQESYHNEEEDDGWTDDQSYTDDPWGYDMTDANFVTPAALAPATHACQRCSGKFTSKSKLFKHLRSECWKVEGNHASETSTDTPCETASETSSETPASVMERQLIESTGKPVLGNGYTFRGSHYATALVKGTREGEAKSCCLDTGCPLSIGGKAYIQETFPSAEIHKLATPLPVRGIGNTVHSSSEYIVANVFIDGYIEEDGKRQPATGRFPVEIHIVDDLKANLLLVNDVLGAQRAAVNIDTQTMTLASCRNLAVPISTTAKRDAGLKRTVRSKADFSVPAGATVKVPVSFHGNLPEDRDFLFEPQCPQPLGHEGGVFAHILDAAMDHVMVRNTSEQPVTLRKRSRLGTLVEYNQQGCYNLTPDAGFLATGGWKTTKQHQRSWKGKLGMAAASAAYAVSLIAGMATGSTGSTSPAVSTNVTTSSGGDFQTSTRAPTISIDSTLEHVLPNGTTVYGKPEVATRIAEVVNAYPTIWSDQGTTVDIPEDQWMPVTLKPDAELKPARVYPASAKDREVIDATFDKMHKDGKMTWATQPTPFSFPAFVVWRETANGPKGRVVVDIRGLNKVTETDSYPLPLQSDLISAVAGYEYISTVDAVGWFHQFNVQRADREKFTVVSHRGQEQSNVALMGFKGSPPYVQRQTDQLLRPYRQFSRAFMDDIVIFSQTLEEHLLHLRQIFELFQRKRVNLSPTKSFLGYPSITLLGQRVDSLGMSTSAEKIAAITSLHFPENLKDLDYFLGLTGWLRHCEERYAQLAQPLTARKTALTKLVATSSGNARKRQSTQLKVADPTPEEISAFNQLQDVFAGPTFLVHFDPERRLFIDLDASKRWGFAAMIYHVVGDPEEGFPRTNVQPILFLSKLLNGAEKNYWPTELEVAGIVWVVKKIRHMIESTRSPPAIIYSDHSAAVPISRQTSLATTSTDKLNLRLVRASQYLSSFNLSVRHKSGKSNVVPDALSRLPGAPQPDVEDKAGVLDALYGHPIHLSEDELRFATLQDMPAIAYHITLVEMSDEFKQRLKTAYTSDTHWSKILAVISPAAASNSSPAATSNSSGAATAGAGDTVPPVADGGDPAAGEEQPGQVEENPPPRCSKFRLREDLIYYVSGEGKDRLCIPEAMEQEVFRITHNLSSHVGFHRAYDRLVNSVYVRHLAKRLRVYIQHCPECQLHQTKRHSPM